VQENAVSERLLRVCEVLQDDGPLGKHERMERLPAAQSAQKRKGITEKPNGKARTAFLFCDFAKRKTVDSILYGI
jgi:hypothetical protein